ncbi:ABC transporter substrate-binding protein, partial [Burkholderia sp. SIMBA_019]
VADDVALCQAVDTAYAASARWCMDHPAECAALVREHLPHMPQAALEAAIRQTRLRSRSAREARADIEALYQLLANRYP